MSGRLEPQAASGRLSRKLSWGFVDQAFSSATNLGLTLIAGRLLGPEGLGIVAIGFTAYVLVLVLERALISEPLVVDTAALDVQTRVSSTESSATLVVALGLAASLVFALLGLLVSGPIGRGLLAVSPWITPAALQDHWRFVLFRENRARSAALNDALWAMVMLGALPLAVSTRTVWASVGAWGIGATAAAVAGFIQTRTKPGKPYAALRWGTTRGWPLGRWLISVYGMNYLGSQASYFLIAAMMGAAAVGELRATQSIFAPMTLIGATIALPGLPATIAALNESTAKARAMSLRLTAIALAAAGVAVAMLIVVGGPLIELLYSNRFRGYEDLLPPVAVAQLVLAAQTGSSLLLKAAKEGRLLLFVYIFAAPATIVAVWRLGVSWELRGAAWGLVVGYAVELALLTRAAWFGTRRRDAPSGDGGQAPRNVETTNRGNNLPRQ